MREVAAAAAVGELRPPRHAFGVNRDDETLRIPHRVYYDAARVRRMPDGARGVERCIVACLGTRHHDGYLRQDCLSELLRCGDAWATPYIVQLTGEYVVEITALVARGIAAREPSSLAAFARQNPAYGATLARRVRSYRHCYYRHACPNVADYSEATYSRVCCVRPRDGAPGGDGIVWDRSSNGMHGLRIRTARIDRLAIDAASRADGAVLARCGRCRTGYRAGPAGAPS